MTAATPEQRREALRTLLDEVFDDIEHVIDGNAGYIDRDMLDRYREDAAAYLAKPHWTERLGPVVACDHNLAQAAQPAPAVIEARTALAADVHELIDGYCPDIPMCPKCQRQERELMDLADDYAATAAPDSPLAADNASLRKERDLLRGQVQAVRRHMEDAAATGMIDSRAILDQLEES